MRSSLHLLALCFLLACRKNELPSPEPTNDATTVAAPTDAAPPPVDLLQFTKAIVAVSSNVDNPHDHPSHLVDGKADTA